MPLAYKIQSEMEMLNREIVNIQGGDPSNDRLSDLRRRVFGRRGGITDEIDLLKQQAGYTESAANKLSDAWNEYLIINASSFAKKRYPQNRTDYMKSGESLTF